MSCTRTNRHPHRNLRYGFIPCGLKAEGEKMEIHPVGTRVVARVDIFDDASNRKVQRHAKAGDTGVVIGYFGDGEVPTIDWGAGSGFGIYDTPWLDLKAV